MAYQNMEKENWTIFVVFAKATIKEGITSGDF